MLSSHRLWPSRWSCPVAFSHIGPGRLARGRMNWSTALAKPSSSWDVVTCVACRRTLLARIAHRDAQAAPLEHQHVGGLIADRRDGLHRDFQVSRQPLDDRAFVGRGVRDVKVVRLRPRGGDLRAERFLKRRFTRGDLSWSSLTPTILTTPASTPSKVGTTVGSH